jgi:hypothetical protein
VTQDYPKNIPLYISVYPMKTARSSWRFDAVDGVADSTTHINNYLLALVEDER